MHNEVSPFIFLSLATNMRSILKKFMILLAVVPLVLVTGEQVIMDPSMKRIQEDMSVDQGYHVNLRRPEKFGYIHSIHTPFVRLPPDQDIRQDEDSDSAYVRKLAHVPDKALIVLSEFKYDRPSDPIVFRGRVSRRTARYASRLKPEYSITFKFVTFDYDHSAAQWFEHIVSGSNYPHARELTGRIVQMRIIDRDIEIVVNPLEGLVQNIAVAESVKRGSIDVGWGPASSVCLNCGNTHCSCRNVMAQSAILQELLF